MKALHVGQRVRIVAHLGFSDDGPATIGKESFIIAILKEPPPMILRGFVIILSGFKGMWFHPDELEPILPEGLEDDYTIEELFNPESEMEVEK